MSSRAEIVDRAFVERVRSGDLPAPVAGCPQRPELPRAQFLDLFESQLISRHLDYAARILKKDNQSFYTIGSAGHEGNAALAAAFNFDDMAFLHYRSGAFFIQRSKQVPGSTPIWDVCLSLVASSKDPISGGRHKVFGSVPLFIPPQTSTIASHLPKAVGAALGIARARDLRAESPMPRDAMIYCSFGDASFNHATAQAALNTASLCAFQNLPVPMVFVCEDNGVGISVKTPENWIEKAARARPMLKYFSCDGRHLSDAYGAAQEAVAYTRSSRRPAFLHMKTVRLLGHAGSDVETLYHGMRLIEATEADDPLLHGCRTILENGYLDAEGIVQLYERVRGQVMRAARAATALPKLHTADAVMKSILPKTASETNGGVSGKHTEVRGLGKGVLSAKIGAKVAIDRQELFGSDWRYIERPQHMAKLLNWGLTDILASHPRTLVFGEDVAQKGGVYHVTSGLWKKFGLKRVFNSPLDETSILGTAIGMAHIGFIPIPEIQFLAYVHNAEDQIRGEAATLSFFSQGQYRNPMVVRVAGLAYQKGFGGHFHNDNSLAVFRDLPGVVIGCPANGADAVRMMRTAVRLAQEEGRVVVFVEPIALYMTKDLLQTGDGLWSFPYPDLGEESPLGELGVYGEGRKLAIVTYGNGVYLSRQAASDLASRYGVPVKVVDLRWLAPLAEKALKDELSGMEAVLVVDECRRTGSQSEALMTFMHEKVPGTRRLARVTAEDSFIPLGVGATACLPSRESIVAASEQLLGVGTQGSSTETELYRDANG